MDSLNLQLKQWLHTIASERKWPDDNNKTVAQAFEEEASSLLKVSSAFPFYDEKYCKVSKKSMIQFDCNLYSVPPIYVGETLAVRATSGHINIYNDAEAIVMHKRSWSKGQKIVMPEHIDAIIKQSHASTQHQHRALIVRRLSSGEALIKAWNNLGECLHSQSRKINNLIKIYGKESVEAASQLALENETPRVDSITHIIQNSEVMPLPVQAKYSRQDLSKYVPEPHDLSKYDNF